MYRKSPQNGLNRPQRDVLRHGDFKDLATSQFVIFPLGIMDHFMIFPEHKYLFGAKTAHFSDEF